MQKDIDEFIDRIVKRYAKKHKKVPPKELRKKAMGKNRDKIQLRVAQLRASHDISALVTVELGFFMELWSSWLLKSVRRFPREKEK
jgi:hypothetical protein